MIRRMKHMPYKDPEDKRRWEQEHRDHRNARRRQRNLGMQTLAASTMPDAVGAGEQINGWKILATIVVGIGVASLAALVGATHIGSAMQTGNPGNVNGQ